MRYEEDQDGFDPFREEYPAHEPQPVGALLPLDKLHAPAGSIAPGPKEMLCRSCGKKFSAKSVWFFGKWRHSLSCLNCADGNDLPPGFLAECKRGSVMQMSCPNCGITRGVDPVLKYNLWHYELTCAKCGAFSMAVRRLRRTCKGCGDDMVVSERHPQKLCKKCSKTESSPY